MEGVYHKNPSMVNGKASWISPTHAIWFLQEDSRWGIGHLQGIGTENEGISSVRVSFICPFQLSSEKWRYYDNGWETSGANETSIQCLSGIFPRY